MSSFVSPSKRRDQSKVRNKIYPNFSAVVGRVGGMWIAYLKDGLNNQVVKTKVK